MVDAALLDLSGLGVVADAADLDYWSSRRTLMNGGDRGQTNCDETPVVRAARV